MIADTSFVIDLLRKDEKAVEKAEKLEKNNRAYSLSSPTVYELWVGVARSNSDQKEEILDIISSQIIYGLDQKSSLEAGKIQKELIENGERIGHMDALIAGIAKKNTGTVLTDNTEEFDRVEGLETKELDH